MKHLNCKSTNLFMLLLLALAVVSCDLTGNDEFAEDTAIHKATSSLQNLLFFDDIEGSAPLSDAHGWETGADHSLTFVDKPGVSNNSAARFELRQNDPDVKGSRRVEVTIVKGEDGHIEKDAWYSYQLYVPSDYDNEEDEEVINQWHQNGNASASIRIKNGEFLWRFYIDGNREDHKLGTVKKGAWNNFVIHMVHSYGSDGVTELWLNGDQLLDLKGRNINDDPLPKWKIGIYKSKWASQKTTVDRRVLYFDNIKVGDSNATYTDLSTDGAVSEVVEEEESISVTDGTSVSGVAISNLVFVDAHTENDVKVITDGGALDMSEVVSQKISIRANAGDAVRSVKYELSGDKDYTHIDDGDPFSLFGDDGNGNFYYGSGLPVGSYRLTATPYSEEDGKGTAGEPYTIRFQVTDGEPLAPVEEEETVGVVDESSSDEQIVEAPESDYNLEVRELTFVNAHSEEDIKPLVDGSAISFMEEVGGHRKLNIRANPSSEVGSVKFELSGTESHSYIDDSDPYAMWGDDGNGNYYYGKRLSLGQYQLTVTPYSEAKGNGEAGKSYTVNFTINQ